MKRFTFIDLFAGIGGFHMAFHKLGKQYPNECVFISEIDDSARKTYEYNFSKIDKSFSNLKKKGNFIGDIQTITSEDIDKIPNKISNKYNWEKSRKKNLTGTNEAYRPKKIKDNKKIKTKYETWKN